MATVIGVVSGLLTIFSFLEDNFSTEQPTNSDTKMRIVAALDGTKGLTDAGGDYPDVRLFGENGEFLGAEYDPGHIDHGTHYDLTIHQTSGRQPAYALFSGNTDAICIAYIAATWPDSQNYGWVGSWGRKCGHSWYHSGISIDGEHPECIWVDANGDSGPVTGFQVHFPEFNPKDKDEEDYNPDVEYYCEGGPPFKTYTGEDPNTITFWTRKRDAFEYATSPAALKVPTGSSYTTRRSGRVRSTIRGLDRDARLIKSAIVSQKATELCDSESSAGPDFISLEEGKFCDMFGRKVWDLCDKDAGIVDDCFDVELNELQYSNLTTRAAPKMYSNVIEWED